VEELVQAIVKSYGIIGLFMLAPIIASVYLWLDNKRLNDKMQTISQQASERIEAAVSKRVEDAQSITNKLVEMIHEQSSLNKETNLALDRIGDMVSMMNAQFNGVNNHTRR
jgi:C4-dicarboxylate-specific signal transduction histidine kinase